MTDPTTSGDPRYREFPAGFFARQDEADDRTFYRQPRLVNHIDDQAIAAVGQVYDQLGLSGRVLDLMSSWVSHFRHPPESLTALGMSEVELAANEQADHAVVADLNVHPALPFADSCFDAAVCCVSVDYLVRPLELFDDVGRVVAPGGTFCCTFSNRCFPSKAIAGWLTTGDQAHVALVARYFELSPPWADVKVGEAIESRGTGDPLYAVWATRAAA